jgi:hypothetical protein
MKILYKSLFSISGLLFCAFLFFITDRGQEILRVEIPANATGFQRDDIYMGAGLAPWAWMLAPAVILTLFGLLMRHVAKKRLVEH